MKVLLDTSVLSDKLLPEISEHLTDRVIEGDTFYISVITHFEILWGLNDLNIQVVPLLKSDVEMATGIKPQKRTYSMP